MIIKALSMSSNLSLNCEIDYIPRFLSKVKCETLYQLLLSTYKIDQKTGPGVSSVENGYGKVMFMTDDLHHKNMFPEEVWGNTAIFPDLLSEIRLKIEKLTGIEFKVCVAIYYPNGLSGVDYHSDFTAFGDTSVIPSLSIGEERLFQLRERETLLETNVFLEEGSLLIMGQQCQENYEHRLPIDPNCKKPRINLTFRQFGYAD